MKTFPFMTSKQSIILLRIAVALFLMAHGLIRIYLGTVGGVGDFLNFTGLFDWSSTGMGITVFEIIGGAAMALGFYVRWIASVFMIQLIMGIFLVHLEKGWFVVGASQGGVEYSALLLVCLMVISAHHYGKQQGLH